MPTNLQLNCIAISGNPIRSLAGLNQIQTLWELYLEGCPILSLHGIRIQSGVIRNIPEQTLRELGAEIIPRGATSIPNRTINSELEMLFSDFTTNQKKYKDLVEHDYAPALAGFIYRMRTSWPKYDSHLRTYLDLSLKDSQFLEILFEEVQTTSANCHDRPLYFFSRLSVIATYYQARQANDMPKMKQSLLAIHSINILEEEAYKVFPNEALEIALYLQLKFKERLFLPIAITSMANEEYAKKNLKSNNIDHFAQRCEEAHKTHEQQIEIICQSQYLGKDTTELTNKDLEKYTYAIELILGRISRADPEFEMGKTIAKKEIEEVIGRGITDTENLSQCIEDLKEHQINEMIASLKGKMQKEIQECLREKAKQIATSGNVSE